MGKDKEDYSAESPTEEKQREIRKAIKSLRELLPIDLGDMENEVADHSKNFTPVARAFADSVVLLKQYELAEDRLKADLYLKFRNQDPKPTEPEIKCLINNDKQYKKLQDEMMEAIRDKVYLDVQVNNYRDRAQNLQALAKYILEREGQGRKR